MDDDLRGIYAATVTPYDETGHPSHEQLIVHLNHLMRRGCDGVLLCGTTGEGPSLTVKERIELVEAVSRAETGLRLLAGTSAASLEDAVTLTRAAFDSGVSGVVVMPPFFYRNAPPEGLRSFFVQLIQRAVPADGKVLLYHNPVATCTAISSDLIRELVDQFPDQVVGIKDSGSDWEHTKGLIQEFPGFQVLVGDDRQLADTLKAGGAGAITGLCNIFADLLAHVNNLHAQGSSLEEAQARLTSAHRQLDDLPRLAAIKALLVAGQIVRNAYVRPPLRPLSEAEFELLKERFNFDLKLAQVIDLDGLTDSD